MSGAIVLLALLPTIVMSSGDGNIKLLEEEVGAAIRACTLPTKEGGRQRRSDDFGYDDQYSDRTPRIDGNTKTDLNQYGHERRNTSDMRDKIHVLNATDYDYGGYGAGNKGEKFVNTIPRPAAGGSYNETMNMSINRTRRSEPLLSKEDSDQCLSQCVFANLLVVDSRGIPREAELWNKVQGSVTSQQSRTALRDQIRACFQELQSEAEDNGCSYSNKLERCLMLRFSDRKPDEPQTEGTQKTSDTF